MSHMCDGDFFFDFPKDKESLSLRYQEWRDTRDAVRAVPQAYIHGDMAEISIK